MCFLFQYSWSLCVDWRMDYGWLVGVVGLTFLNFPISRSTHLPLWWFNCEERQFYSDIQGTSIKIIRRCIHCVQSWNEKRKMSKCSQSLKVKKYKSIKFSFYSDVYMPVAVILAIRWHSELKDISIDILAGVSRMPLNNLNWHFSDWKRESVWGGMFFSLVLAKQPMLIAIINFCWALLI